MAAPFINCNNLSFHYSLSSEGHSLRCPLENAILRMLKNVNLVIIDLEIATRCGVFQFQEISSVLGDVLNAVAKEMFHVITAGKITIYILWGFMVLTALTAECPSNSSKRKYIHVCRYYTLTFNRVWQS